MTDRRQARATAVDLLVALGGDREAAEQLIAIGIAAQGESFVTELLIAWEGLQKHGFGQAEVKAAIVERAGATIQ
jgi:hypothetical protein